MARAVCIAFSNHRAQEKQPAHWHGVKHYWLCTRCCGNYTIEYQKDVGVLLMERLDTMAGDRPCYFVLQAEIVAKPPLPRRVARSRSRQAHRKSNCPPLVQRHRNAGKSERREEGFAPMNETIGTMAGAIWQVLESKGEITLAKLKQELNAKSPLFDWAVGWLAREDKIVLTIEKRTLRIRLKGWARKAFTPHS